MTERSSGMGVPAALRRMALLALCTLMACSSDGSSTAPEEVSVEIGEKGGTLIVKGARLAIPEGALDEPVVLTAKNRGRSVEPPAKVKKQLSDLVEFGPEGTTFKKDVELTFDLDEEAPTAKVFFSREGEPNQFEELPTVHKGGRVSANVKHFSQGFVAIPAEDVGDSDAGERDASESSADASGADAGETMDAQASDAGATDTGLAEAGSGGGGDATGPVDAGAADASARDTGVSGTHISVNSRDGVGNLVNQTWAAFQDGDGVWQRVMPAKPGVYEFDVKSSGYGFAIVCADQTGAYADGTLSYYPSGKTALDVVAMGTACAAGNQPIYAIQGNLVMPGGHDFYRYGHYNTGGAIQSPAGAGRAWSISSFPGNAMRDLVLAASIDANTGLSSFLIFRDLLLSQPAVRDADFIKSGTPAGPTFSVSVDNASADAGVDVYYVTDNATLGLPLRMSTTISPNATTRSMTYASVPVAIARATDAYVARGSESTAGSSRVVSERFTTANNVSLLLPDGIGAVLSMVKTPYHRPSINFGDYVGVERYTLTWNSTPTAGVRRSFETTIDPAWFTGVGSHTVVFPDFTGTPGFDPIWVLPANATGQSVYMDVQAHRTLATPEGFTTTRASAFTTVQLN